MGRLDSSLNRLSKMIQENRYINGAVALVQEVFVTLLFTFILLLLVETIWERSVSSFLNIDYLLIAVIVAGVIAVLTWPGEVKEEGRGRLGRMGIVMLVCFGIGGAAIVWYKTMEMGWLSYVISVVSGGLIVLLSMLIWREDGEEDSEGENSQGS